MKKDQDYLVNIAPGLLPIIAFNIFHFKAHGLADDGNNRRIDIACWFV